MSILSRVLLHPNQRFDLEDYQQAQIDALTDAKFWTKQFLSENPLILKGFTVSGLNAPSPCSVSLTDATLINASHSEHFSWYSAQNSPSPLSVVLQPGSRNYLELSLTEVDGTPLNRAFWDPSANGGSGSEFQQNVDTVTDIDVQVVVNTTSFTGSTDRIPLAIIDTDGSNVVKLILDKRPLFFRLGDPNNSLFNFAWGSQTEPAITLTLSGVSGTFSPGETINFSGGATAKLVSGTSSPLQVVNLSSNSLAVGNTVTGASSSATGTLVTVSEAFTGADKDIDDFKEALNAVMTEIKRLKGTDYWFESGFGSILGEMRFINSVLIQNSSNARFGFDGSNMRITDDSGTPSSSDILGRLRIFGYSGNLNLSRQDGTGGSTNLAISEGQVLFIKLPTSGDRTYSGLGSGDTNYQVVSRASFTLNDQNYWLAYRENSKLYLRGMKELESGEEDQIGDDISAQLLTALGLSETDPTPNYTSDIRGIAGQSFLARISALTDAVGDEQEDRSAFIRSASPVVWTGSALQFTDDIVLEIINTKSGTLTTHTILASNSPINLTNNQLAYISIDRTLASENVVPTIASSTPAQSQANKDIFVLFKRIDLGSPTQSFLFLPFNKQVFRPGQSSYLGASGSGSGIIKVDLHDPVSTSLPSGPSATLDGVSVTNGMRVLFSNLSSGNNRVYQASGVGVSISWAAVFAFDSGQDPTTADLVIIKQGTGFANQIGEFNGTNWLFNKTVRYFTGANYVEFESIKSSTLTNNTTANVFSVTASGSENWEISYTVVRGSTKESGKLYLSHDGTNARVTKSVVEITGDVGVTFTADISAGNLRLRYTTTNTGADATMNFFYWRWSDSPGGPAGVPSYAGGGSPVSAAGSTGDVQFKGSGGNLDANAKFNWDNTNQWLNLNGLKVTPQLGPLTVLDNQGAYTTLLTLDKTQFKYVIMEYTLNKGGEDRIGRLMFTNNGTVMGDDDDYVETAGGTGVNFQLIVSGSNVLLQYTSTNTGANGTFHYWMRFR